VKWGDPENGPYTITAEQLIKILHVNCAIVSLPPDLSVANSLAWTTLGHECGGHDVLHADEGLLDELKSAVGKVLKSNKFPTNIIRYWQFVIDELASDVCGALHFGPAAGIGQIIYFRYLFNGPLRNIVSTDDPHPIDVLRGYATAAVIREVLQYDKQDQEAWATIVESETDKDLKQRGGQVALYDRKTKQYVKLDLQKMKDSARLTALTIAQAKMQTLEQQSLSSIKNWTSEDQDTLKGFLYNLSNNTDIPVVDGGFKAAHVIAAASLFVVSKAGAGKLDTSFNWMIRQLDKMHDSNPMWKVDTTFSINSLSILTRTPLAPKYVKESDREE